MLNEEFYKTQIKSEETMKKLYIDFIVHVLLEDYCLYKGSVDPVSDENGLFTLYVVSSETDKIAPRYNIKLNLNATGKVLEGVPREETIIFLKQYTFSTILSLAQALESVLKKMRECM